MNLRDLKYLVAVADCKNFSKAAKTCFVSQPALSMQLQKLEDSLGVKLLERNNKRVMVTEVGRDIVERARKILREAEEIEEVAATYHDPFVGKFRLGAFPTLAPYLLPEIVPIITQKYPKLKMFLIEDKTDILINQLKSGQIDAAFLALPIDDDSLEYTQLFKDRFFLAVSYSHHLANQDSINNSDLKNESLLLLEDGHCLREHALDVCSLTGMSEKQDFRATSLETLRQMVASDVGITLIPELAKKDNDGIVYIPFAKNEPSRTICLVWRKTSARKNTCLEMADIIKNCALVRP